MAISTFSPASPDAFLLEDSDMSLAKFGHINAIVNELNTKATIISTANVTQSSSITSGVTVNAEAGVITTVSSTLAADASASFVVTNSKVLATSKVLVSVQYAGNGIAYSTISAIADGSFTVKLYNAHSSAALNAVVLIHFSVIN
jgi:hypothetical protein